MATWGDFLAEFQVMSMKPIGMVVKADEVIDVWEERNRLREEVAQLQQGLATEREACAQEIEEFAAAFEQEGEEAAFVAKALRMAAGLIRDRGTSAEETAAALPEPSVEPPPTTVDPEAENP